jgi:amino acid transporter
MSENFKLSLPVAILINVNIMLGTGVFINTVELAKRAGALGFLSYMIVGLLMLPLIASFATLMKIYPEGGFYAFAKNELSPLAGFISAWSYFIAKMASASLMVHVSMSLLQKIIPALQVVPTLGLDALVFIIFTFLNMLGLKTGSAIQTGFMILKIIPISFAIFTGLFLFSGSNFVAENFLWQDIPSTIPLVLYVMLGFEAVCAMSHTIQDARRNAPIAIYSSYAIVISVVCFYQFMFFAGVGSDLMTEPSYLNAFPKLLSKLLTSSVTAQNTIAALLYIAVSSSALGGCYGIMFSNNWNLYTLAQHNHLFFSRAFATFNKYQVPFLCIMAEGILGISYLLLTGGHQITLQQLAALGNVIMYTLSIIALLLVLKRTNKYELIWWWVPRIALFNCGLLAAACVRNFMISGIMPLLGFSALLGFGIMMFFVTKKTTVA